MKKEIVSYALEITWNDGTKEIRTDFPAIEYINEYLDEIEREFSTEEVWKWLEEDENVSS